MEQRPWEAHSSLVSQEVSHILWISVVYDKVHKSLLVPANLYTH